MNERVPFTLSNYWQGGNVANHFVAGRQETSQSSQHMLRGRCQSGNKGIVRSNYMFKFLLININQSIQS